MTQGRMFTLMEQRMDETLAEMFPAVVALTVGLAVLMTAVWMLLVARSITATPRRAGAVRSAWSGRGGSDR